MITSTSNQHVKMLPNNLPMQERTVDVEPLVLVLRTGRQVRGVEEEREEKRRGNHGVRFCDGVTVV